MQVLSRRRGVPLIEVAGLQWVGVRPTRRSAPAAGTGRARGSSRQHACGFTMVELMITLVIAVVLITIAVPSFKQITLSSKLTTVANDMVGAINTARMEAIKRNASTQFCGSSSNGGDTLGTACTLSGVVQTGAVYVQINGAATPVRAPTTGITAPIVLTSAVVAVRFSGQGLAVSATGTVPFTGPGAVPFAGLIADISTSSMSTDNHRCINMTAGSILVTTTTSGVCPP